MKEVFGIQFCVFCAFLLQKKLNLFKTESWSSSLGAFGNTFAVALAMKSL